MDAEVAIFFTFDGLSIIHRNASELLKLGRGKEHLAAGFQNANVPSVSALLDIAKDCGVRFIGCQMTMDVIGIRREDLIDGVELGGAATFLDFAFDADVSLNF